MTIFQEVGSILKQNRAKTIPKRTNEPAENMKNFEQENPRTSPRKSSSQDSCTKPTLWSIYGESCKKILAENSTVILQFNHWQMLRSHNGRIFANELLSNHQALSRKSCGQTNNSFVFTKSHTGRMMEFGLTKFLFTFVRRMIETMSRWWSSLKLFTEWLQ